jgi:hypothetical protein
VKFVYETAPAKVVMVQPEGKTQHRPVVIRSDGR